MSDKDATPKPDTISIEITAGQAGALISLIDAGLRSGGLNALGISYNAAPVIDELVSKYNQMPEVVAAQRQG